MAKTSTAPASAKKTIQKTTQKPIPMFGLRQYVKKITVVFQPCERVCEVDNRWSLKNMGSHGNGPALKVPRAEGWLRLRRQK